MSQSAPTTEYAGKTRPNQFTSGLEKVSDPAPTKLESPTKRRKPDCISFGTTSSKELGGMSEKECESWILVLMEGIDSDVDKVFIRVDDELRERMSNWYPVHSVILQGDDDVPADHETTHEQDLIAHVAYIQTVRQGDVCEAVRKMTDEQAMVIHRRDIGIQEVRGCVDDVTYGTMSKFCTMFFSFYD